MHSFIARALLLSTLAITGITSWAQEQPADTTDTDDVAHVMAAFQDAVLTHDGARLARLFLPQSVWFNVLSDDAYALARARSADAVKVRPGSYADFARLVSTTKASFNPEHTHLQLNSDGTIASVYFDFVFLVDGKAQNRGSETWQLIKGIDGWRIAAISYSSNPVQLQK